MTDLKTVRDVIQTLNISLIGSQIPIKGVSIKGRCSNKLIKEATRFVLDTINRERKLPEIKTKLVLSLHYNGGFNREMALEILPYVVENTINGSEIADEIINELKLSNIINDDDIIDSLAINANYNNWTPQIDFNENSENLFFKYIFPPTCKNQEFKTLSQKAFVEINLESLQKLRDFLQNAQNIDKSEIEEIRENLAFFQKKINEEYVNISTSKSLTVSDKNAKYSLLENLRVKTTQMLEILDIDLSEIEDIEEEILTPETNKKINNFEEFINMIFSPEKSSRYSPLGITSNTIDSILNYSKNNDENLINTIGEKQLGRALAYIRGELTFFSNDFGDKKNIENEINKLRNILKSKQSIGL